MSRSGADPRTTRVEVISGPASMLGTCIIVDPVRIGSTTIHFPRAISGVSEYAAVANAEQRAESLRPMLVQNLQPGPAPYQADETLVFEFLEHAKTATIMASAGVEAFASHHIVRALGTNPSFQGNDPFQLPLEERLKTVLPNLLGVNSPTGEHWWSDLRRVQALAAMIRHALHHQTRRKGLSGDRPLIERLYRGEYRGASRTMLSLFEFFSPGWIPPDSLKQLPTAL